MATLAEQNAVRCREAGNVLYKSERYEEVSSEEQNASRVFVSFLMLLLLCSRSRLAFFGSLMRMIFSKSAKSVYARLFMMNALSLSLVTR